jgi:hypothetical protein
VGPRGIYIGPGYIKDIKNWPRPNNKKEVERFLGNSNKPYLVINAVLEQSSGLIFTCQYAELASSLEYHTFPAKVSRHSSTRGNGNTSLMVRAFKAR